MSVGVCSYSVYLIHEPLIRLIYSITSAFDWPAWVCFLVYQGVIMPGCVVVGCLFFLVAERPFLVWQQAPQGILPVAPGSEPRPGRSRGRGDYLSGRGRQGPSGLTGAGE